MSIDGGFWDNNGRTFLIFLYTRKKQPNLNILIKLFQAIWSFSICKASKFFISIQKMSRFEVLTPELLRSDGRRATDLRTFATSASLASSDGSFLRQGNTHVLVSCSTSEELKIVVTGCGWSRDNLELEVLGVDAGAVKGCFSTQSATDCQNYSG